MNKCDRCGKADSRVVDFYKDNKRQGEFCSLGCYRMYQADSEESKEENFWINAESESPPVGEIVLLCADGVDGEPSRIVGYLHKYGDYCEQECNSQLSNVTHWQPLPPLPKKPEKPEPKKRQVGCCEDCQHWVDPYPGGEIAVCNILTFSASPYVGATNLAKLGERFRTNKAFGCTEFQERGDVAPSFIS